MQGHRSVLLGVLSLATGNLSVGGHALTHCILDSTSPPWRRTSFPSEASSLPRQARARMSSFNDRMCGMPSLALESFEKSHSLKAPLLINSWPFVELCGVGIRPRALQDPLSDSAWLFHSGVPVAPAATRRNSLDRGSFQSNTWQLSRCPGVAEGQSNAST